MANRFLESFKEEIKLPTKLSIKGWIIFGLLVLFGIAPYIVFLIFGIKSLFWVVFGASFLGMIISCVLLFNWSKKVEKEHQKKSVLKIIQDLIDTFYFSQDATDLLINLQENTNSTKPPKYKFVNKVQSSLSKTEILIEIYTESVNEIKRKKKIIIDAFIALVSSGGVATIVAAIIDNNKVTEQMPLYSTILILMTMFAILAICIVVAIDDNVFYLKELNYKVLLSALKQYQLVISGEIEIEDKDIESNKENNEKTTQIMQENVPTSQENKKRCFGFMFFRK